MPSASRFGATSPPNPIPLYVCSAIVDDAEAAAQHFDPMTNQRRDYYIGLFHEIRWHASKKTSRKSKVPEWMALCQSWNAFVENFNKDAKAYRARITAAHLRCETCSRRHMIDRLHNEAMEAGIPCTVPFGTACSHCPLGLSVSPSEMSPGTRLCVYLFSCVISAFNLERRDERRDSPSVSGDRSARAGVTATLRSGLRTPSPFPERPPSERSEVLMYLGGEEILSNEYEDEPDLDSSSGVHSPRFARLSTESSRPHRAVFQSEEFAQLQQELRYQKAQVAQAAQTASNIQVELGSHIVRLHDLVVAPEKLAYADSSFSASHQD
ncbi:hypothetical protein PC118_g24211 [Phytophthora cactorum]|nr:hypothetical protein PC114_g26966 [Phytophthora cactorum]KAG2885929.1 hypothetical protein PC117_g25485 [Phytophthora cactorum]KAG2957020.1 hypothetical protein PC118_g24211 [Phytophthora cactorum]KAG3047660.1 hypothetical protein PC122_g24047 [Phytophthora cactorum]